MKFNLLKYFSFALIISSSCASAADVYWSGNSTTSGLGLYNSDAWTGKVLPTASDDVFIDEDYIKGLGRNLVDGFINANTTWNSLTLNYTAGDKKLNTSAGKPVTLTILNDLVKTGAGIARFAMGSGGSSSNIDIGRNVIVGKDKDTSGGLLYFGNPEDSSTQNWGGPLESLRVGGSVTLYNYSNLYFNVVRKAGSDLSSADVYIDGIIDCVGSGAPSYQNPTICLINREAAAASATSIISVKAIQGSATLIANTYTTNNNQLAILHIRGNENKTYIFDGWISEVNHDFNAMSKLGITKDGVSTQKMTGDKLKFSGGVEVNGGTLVLNGMAEGRDKTHGDLTISGGTLRLEAKKTEDYGKNLFTFTNFNYSDGTIALRVANNSIDKLVLTGMLNANSIDAVMKFELLGSDFAFLEEDYRMIIGWAEISGDFTKDDFIVTNLNGKYEADFDLRQDGLYLKLNAIPEPATVASILGAIVALIFISKRKR